MFATEPTIVRLPPKVVASASTFHQLGIGKARDPFPGDENKRNV